MAPQPEQSGSPARGTASEDRVRRIVRVTGRVQGVGFRVSTLMQADRLGVTGTVRNLWDGSVEADAEGSPAAVAQMLDWLEEGPPSARVDRIDVRADAPRGATAFRIA